jgi:hypothetical protein
MRRPKATTNQIVAQVLAWADAYHRRTGRWPGVLSGPIAGAPSERWAAVTTRRPSGLKQAVETSQLCRSGGVTGSPVAASQTRAVWSLLAVPGPDAAHEPRRQRRCHGLAPRPSSHKPNSARCQ